MESNQPFNFTVILVMGNDRFHNRWDHTYGNTYKVSKLFLRHMQKTRYSPAVDNVAEESYDDDG